MSTAVRTPPNHDTLTCYTKYQCRRPACIARVRAYESRRREGLAAGTWKTHVDANPVREHLTMLAEHGVSLHRAAELAGIGPRTLHPLFPPQGGRRRPARHTVRIEVAEKILAIDPERAVPAKVDPTGTARRIEALVANGWPMEILASQFGFAIRYVSAIIQRSEKNQQVYATTAEKVAAGYARLEGLRPTGHGVTQKQAKRARTMAAARNWPNARYWASRMDAIDDPHFQPDYGVTKAQALAEDARWLMATNGLNRDQVAERLGKSRCYIDKVLSSNPTADEQAAA